MNPKRTSKILGTIGVIYGGLFLVYLTAIISFVIFFITESKILSSTLFSYIPIHKIFYLTLIFSLLLITGFLWVIGSIGLVRNRKWARTMIIITSIMSLISFPTGTIMGVFYFIFMFKRDIKEHYAHTRF
tara:strand:+ start:406 stop:795 length:390 start_codon:yes stop_codon:yes gene_type:complete